MTKTSWGNYPKVTHSQVIQLNWRDEVIFFQEGKNYLAYGQGRSYGDSCLNENGILISTTRLNRLIHFDAEVGILECEAGVTLANVLDFILPHAWFLPVLPGTQFVSIGGAIANDVHGKNHHNAGTFGNHVLSFELLRSNGERVICSPHLNKELYQATIGGLGLTGIILSAKIKLKSITSSFLSVQNIQFKNLNEFFELTKKAEEKYEYTVAWLDCVSSKKKLGSGVLICANHVENTSPNIVKKKTNAFTIPFYLPHMLLNRYSVKAFNNLYFQREALKTAPREMHYKPFFFPLDAVHNWNRMYGKNGFVQYQCVLPEASAHHIADIVKNIVNTGQASFLSVLKTFGDNVSPGMLSFPMKGVTLALDLPYRGQKTHTLLNELDSIVMQQGGRVYPAKDANMSSAAFKHYFPQWESFSKWIDPKLSSSLWRRVMKNET